MPLLMDCDNTGNAVTEDFISLAFAFLDGAEVINEAICSGRREASFDHGRVVMFMTYHSCELFLKGCISISGQETSFNKHGTLVNLRDKAYSINPSFEFDLPFEAEPIPEGWPPQIQEEVRHAIEKDRRDKHKKLRYPIDTSGKRWLDEGLNGFYPELFALELKRLRDQFTTGWELMASS